MEVILDKVMTFIAKDNNLDEEEAEVVRYGLEIVITRILFAIVIVIVGLLMGCFFESVVFVISFSLIREYGGGYHAETRIKCFWLSLITLVVSLGIIILAKNFPVMTLPFITVSIISAIYILRKAPIDTANKRLDKDEIRVYGNKARGLTVILLFVAVLLLYFRVNNIAFAILTGIIIEAYLMIKGQIANYINGEKV